MQPTSHEQLPEPGSLRAVGPVYEVIHYWPTAESIAVRMHKAVGGFENDSERSRYDQVVDVLGGDEGLQMCLMPPEKVKRLGTSAVRPLAEDSSLVAVDLLQLPERGSRLGSHDAV